MQLRHLFRTLARGRALPPVWASVPSVPRPCDPRAARHVVSMLRRTTFSQRTALASLVAPFLLASACDSDPDTLPAGDAKGGTAGHLAGGHGGKAAAGTGDVPNAGAPDATGGTSATGGGSSGSAGTHRGGGSGSSGEHATGGSGGSNAAGSGDDEPGGGSPGGTSSGGASGGPAQGGSTGAPARLAATVESGQATTTTAPRPAYGAVLLANDGSRIYAVESRRDDEPGPFGLPWRSRFRVAAYADDAAEVWSYAADPDDVVSDVVVHPSGDVTIAVLHQALDRHAYDLLRFDRDGTPLGTTTLTEPTTIPDADLGAVARPLFRMKSDLADATVSGWVRLIADGEGLFAVILSYIDRPPSEPLSARWALGLEAFDWDAGSFEERWARVVEGPHRAQPATWTYDELRWLEQAISPSFARDDVTHELLVGRAWNTTRCETNVEVFAEFAAEDCLPGAGAVDPVANERLPLAVTRFSELGERLGTTLLAPDEDAAEQVAFALAAHGGKLYTAGAVVRENPDGSKRTYPDPSGYVDYDGYIAVYEPSGALIRHHDFNLGRGDVLAALRVTPAGIVAVGSAGWDRWQGGMSISHGADPLLAWLSPDGTSAATRVLPMSGGSRHFNLHDVLVTGETIVAQGFSDAPMTHSADGGHDEARTFGPLRIRLSPP